MHTNWQKSPSSFTDGSTLAFVNDPARTKRSFVASSFIEAKAFIVLCFKNYKSFKSHETPSVMLDIMSEWPICTMQSTRYRTAWGTVERKIVWIYAYKIQFVYK